MKLLVLLLCFSNIGGSEEARFPVEGGSSFVSRVCGQVGTAPTVELSCPNNTWFHVLHKVSSNQSIATDNCSSAPVPAANRATTSSTSVPGLVPECRGWQGFGSGDQLCNETIQVSQEYNVSRVELFEVKYDCIEDSLVYNMCDKISREIISGDVYLASPSFYPLAPAVAPDSNCSCRLTTTDNFTAHAVYVSLPANYWNVTCQQCAITFQKQYEALPIVNKEIFTNTTQNQTYELHIELQGSSQNSTTDDNELWISFTGGGSLILQCNGGVNVTATPADGMNVTAAPGTATSSDETSTNMTTTITSVENSAMTMTTGDSSAHNSTTTTATTTQSSTTLSSTPTTTETTNTMLFPSSTDTTSNTSLTGATNVSSTNPSSPVASSSTDDALTTSTVTSSSSTGFKDTHIYIIVGVVGGIVVITIVLFTIVCRRKRSKRAEKMDLQMDPMEPPGYDRSSTCLSPHRPDSNYSVIDLADDDNDTRIPSYSEVDYTTAGNNHKPGETPSPVDFKGKVLSPGQQGLAFPKHVDENPDKVQLKHTDNIENPTAKNEYFILEPDPAALKEHGVLFLIEEEDKNVPNGEHFVSVKTGTTTVAGKDVGTFQQTSSTSVDDTARDSNPYYSEIKEIDYSLTPAPWKVFDKSKKGASRQSTHQGITERESTGDYEDVEFVEENQLAPQPNTNISSVEPSQRGILQNANTASHSPPRTPDSGCIEDDEEMVMIDNVAYESADEVLGNTTGQIGQTQSDDAGDDDDELVMIDNVAYESADDIVGDVRQTNGQQDNDVDADDDELVMVDNVAYESIDSLGKSVSHQQNSSASDYNNDSSESSGTPGQSQPAMSDTSHPHTLPDTLLSAVPCQEEDNEECVMIDNVLYESSSALGVDDIRQGKHSNP